MSYRRMLRLLALAAMALTATSASARIVTSTGTGVTDPASYDGNVSGTENGAIVIAGVT